jgi:peroxiredoxin/outer membrane lipoprotein-sorting protein
VFGHFVPGNYISKRTFIEATQPSVLVPSSVFVSSPGTLFAIIADGRKNRFRCSVYVPIGRAPSANLHRGEQSKVQAPRRQTFNRQRVEFHMIRLIALSFTTACLGTFLCPQLAAQEEFKGDTEGRALYDQMVKTMHEATSLSFESEYRWESQGKELGHATYRIWLKKPNQFRLEASKFGSDTVSGVLVGDGENLWIYWPDGKPRYMWEYSGKFADEYEKIRQTCYMTSPTPLGNHSIAHEALYLGVDMAMTILDLSIFHGYSGGLQNNVDGVRHSGTETIDGTKCDVIEVALLANQRTWQFWLSKEDHLPRKLREVVRVEHELNIQEDWTNVALNGEIADDKFVWSPPAEWTQWKTPPMEVGLLEPGTVAPDFELASIDGGKIRLSDFRGKFVWLFKWRVGCPPCRTEIVDVQAIYAKFRDKGLVVLGVNNADAKEFVTEVLQQNHVTFPNVVDTSDDASNALAKFETLAGASAVPMTYIIDREGKVVDAWYGDAKEKREAAITRLNLGE